MEAYRAAGEEAGRSEEFRVGIGFHTYVAADARGAREIYPYYRDFLAPKRPGVPGIQVGAAEFSAGFHPAVARAIGTSNEILDKLTSLHGLIRFDRLQILPDWGGMPRELARRSLERFSQEVAPELRRIG